MAIDLNVPRVPKHTVLVVDDDRRVRELLEVALTAHGFRVITANDGEEAVRRALTDHPDLVVLDVRLPRKSGLEVCDALRGDPSQSSMPVILVSAISETDARLQAFSRGADDFLPKPFSPKELIARIKRLLERSSEAQVARHRARELERELKLAREATRRAHLDSLHERGLRELSLQAGRELGGILDLDELARTALRAIQAGIGVRVAALLVRDGDEGLGARAIRGDGFERIAGLDLSRGGELACFLHGLGRPAPRHELQKFPELRDDVASLIARGFALAAPVRGADGLEALLLIEERLDGNAFSREDGEILTAYCEALVHAIPNANRLRKQLDQWLDALALRAHRSASERGFHAEAADLVTRSARALAMLPRSRELLGHGVAIGAWVRGATGRAMMDRFCTCDPTGRLNELVELIEQPVTSPIERPIDGLRAAFLLEAGLGFARLRAAGEPPVAALALALAELPGADTEWARELGETLASAVREDLAREAAAS